MPPERSDVSLPLPEHRRRRIGPLMIAGAVALVAGWLLDIGFVWGLGAGTLLTGGIVLLLDTRARRRQGS